ncbi:MAG: hypothetical protein AAF337_11875 [Pseudomonadota bacterium]
MAGKPAFGILAPATFFLIYDPSTAPGFKLGDVLGYEKRWGPYRGKIPKEPPLFNYTGAWPIGGYQPIGKAYQIGRPPMIVITMDALRTSFKLSLPPGYRQTPTPVPELLNTYRATWGKEPLGDKPTFLTINAGDGRNILLEATLGAFKQRKFEKLHGKMRHVGDEQLTDQYFYADFQTYKDGVFKMKQDMVKEKKMPNMAYTQAADAMLGYFINAAKGSNDMLTITAAEKGQFVYKISVGGFRKAAELLAKGLVHHRQNVLNPDCW